MAMEGKDFDDKAIMAATRQEVGNNDSFRLSITMPLSGRSVTSEWIRQDKRREALFAWVNTIRNEAASDIADYEVERKAKAMAERAKTQSPSLIGQDGSALTTAESSIAVPQSSDVRPARSTGSSSAASVVSDPDAYIGDQLKRALIREVEASDALARATQEHADAVKNLEKWKKLQDALLPKEG